MVRVRGLGIFPGPSRGDILGPTGKDLDHEPAPGSRRTGNLRNGVTTDEVLMLYLGQYRVERAFRTAKSELEADSVYIHRPSRANVFVFVVFLGMIVAGIIDAIMRKEGLLKTAESMIGDLSSHRQIRQI